MEIERKLPSGWVETELRTLLQLIRNGLVTEQHKDSFGIPISRIETISKGKIDFDRVRYVKDLEEDIKEQFLVQKGDILFSHINSDLHLGKTAVFDSPKELLHGMNLLLLRVDRSCIEPYYLHYQLNHLRAAGKFIAVAQHAVNQSSLNQAKINTFSIKLAPLKEQKRIVSKIEELFSDLDEGEIALQKVQKLLTRYRQSVLKAAFTGKLTKDWRVANHHQLESGSVLLKRIFQTRCEQWQGKGRYHEPAAPDTSNIPELPEEWVWCSLDSLIIEGPTNGFSPKASQINNGGIKSFKLTATTSGEFIISDETIKYISAQVEADSKYWLKAGDLLVQRGNTIDYVGTAAVFPGPDNEFIYPDLMMRLRVADKPLSSWLAYWINFFYAREYFKKNATGIAGNMPKINGETLKKLPVPMASKEEILLILSELDNLKQYTTVVSKNIKAQQKNSVILRQSILKDAFSGKLVLQDPTDESADELLKRIQTEREEKPVSNSMGNAHKKEQPSLWETI